MILVALSIRDILLLGVISSICYTISVLVFLLLISAIEAMSPLNVVRQTVIRQAMFLGFPLALLGVVVGYATGLSRSSAVGDVLPAVLTFLGALSVYLMAQEKKSALIAAVCVLVISVSLIAGMGYGSRLRFVHELQAKSFQTLRAMAHDELNIKKYRKAIGLDD